MVDFSTYQPPGVYVEEAQTPLVSLRGTAASAVAIIGPSRGYQNFTEIVILHEEAATPLAKLGIVTNSIAVSSLDGTTDYVVTTDYAVAQTPGDDAQIGEIADNPTTIARVQDGDIGDGHSVVVSYRYADPDYFGAKRFTDYEDVKDFYGQPFDIATGAVISPLSMAARFAFQNGAREIILVSTDGSNSLVTTDELAAGYAKVATLFDVGIVVPLSVGISGTDLAPGDVINVGGALALHATQASADGYQRIGIFGAEAGVTIDPADIAAGVASSRVILAHPNRLNFFNGFANQVVEVPGYYLAAALAGILARNPVQQGLTKQLVQGFAGIPADLAATMTKSIKDAWSSGGVAVAELTRQRTLQVRHGTTTDRSSVLTREPSVVRAKDTMVRSMQETLDGAGIIGSPITENSVINVKGIVAGVLESMVDTGVIISYRDLKSRLKPGEPEIIEVKFEYKPAYPLNYIIISFSVDTTTGETDFDATLGELTTA